MNKEQIEQNIRSKYEVLLPLMNEQVRRRWAATEARALGYGGLSVVSRATGLSRNTIASGMRENEEPWDASFSRTQPRIRHKGGGRKSISHSDPAIRNSLETLVDPVTRGDPESPLRWTCKSTRNLAKELRNQGHPIGERTVSRLLKENGYSLQSNRKSQEGSQHPDRNAQFE